MWGGDPPNGGLTGWGRGAEPTGERKASGPAGSRRSVYLQEVLDGSSINAVSYLSSGSGMEGKGAQRLGDVWRGGAVVLGRGSLAHGVFTGFGRVYGRPGQ